MLLNNITWSLVIMQIYIKIPNKKINFIFFYKNRELHFIRN